MAAYFPTFRRQSRQNPVPVEQATPASHAQAEVNADQRWVPSASILIFPSPSSSIPPTPASSNDPLPHGLGSASMSNFSLPTSISVESGLESASEKSTPSSYRRIRLRRQGQPIQRAGHASGSGDPHAGQQRHSVPRQLEVDLESVSEATGDRDMEVELWEWSQTSSQEASPARENVPGNRFMPSHTVHYPGGEAVEISWPPNLRQRTISQFTQISNTSNVSQLSYFSHSTTPSSSQPTPPTPLYFPFISLIKQLLGIDQETIMLLGALGCSSGAEADLFLASPFDNLESTRKFASMNRGSFKLDGSTELRHNPLVALLKQSTIDSNPSTSANSIKAGLQAAVEQQAEVEVASQRSGPWRILLSFNPATPSNIQEFLLSPVKLTTSIASGAVNATTSIIGHSSNAVGSALNAVARPVVSVAEAVGLGRGESVPAAA